MAFLGAEMSRGSISLRGRRRWSGVCARRIGDHGRGSDRPLDTDGQGRGPSWERCRELKIPCIGLAGMVSASPGTGACFTQAHALTELTSVAQAKAKAGVLAGAAGSRRRGAKNRAARRAYWRRHEEGVRRARNPKAEIRNPKEGRNPKPEKGVSRCCCLFDRRLIRNSDFGFLSDFGFREFGFGLGGREPCYAIRSLNSPGRRLTSGA